MSTKGLVLILVVFLAITDTSGAPTIRPIKKLATKLPILTTTSIPTTPAEELDPFGLLPLNQFIVVYAVSGGVFILFILCVCCLCCCSNKTTYADMTRAEIAAGLTPSMIDKGFTKSIIAPPVGPVDVRPQIVMLPPIMSPMMAPPYGFPVPMPYPGYPPVQSQNRNKVDLPPGVVLPKSLKGVKPKNR